MTKVLIVEDEAPIAHAYQIVLEQAGFEVLVANQAQSAVHLVQSERPDVILLDVLMPEMNGLDMLKKMELPKNLPDTVVIALSNIDTASVVSEATKLGVSEYLRKVDYTPHQIVEVVKKHLAS
ncbi:MAG TPA: response regulator [Candidatus Saccharimonadales bacterium]|nr:response regulator [Candidatus Saccharimonadales bacterium]